MQIDWDEEKRQENIRKHGIDFVGAEAIFDGDTLTTEDTRRDYGNGVGSRSVCSKGGLWCSSTPNEAT